MNTPAEPLESPRQSGEILDRVKLALTREAQATTLAEPKLRPRLQELDARHAGAARGNELAIEQGGWRIRRQEQVAVHTLEIARDALLLDDRVDEVDRRSVALRR